MRHLELTEIAGADLKSIRRYSQRTWGPDRTAQYMAALRDTMKGLLTGTVVSRNHDDLRPGLLMATNGRQQVFFEADQSRILVVRVLHDRMDYQRPLDADAALTGTGKSRSSRTPEFIHRPQPRGRRGLTGEI